MKKDFGYTNYPEEAKRHLIEEVQKTGHIVSFDEFRSHHYRKKLIAGLSLRNRIYCALYASERLRMIKYKLTGRPPKLKVIRLARLAEYLSGIDLQRDVLDWLE